MQIPLFHCFRLTRLFSALGVLFLLTIAIALQAQPLPNQLSPATMTGAPPYSTHEMVREDVALASGGLHVYIPILSLQGKGGQKFSLGWAHDSHGITLQEYDQGNGWNNPQNGALEPYDYANWVVSLDLLGYITVPHLRGNWQFEGDYCYFDGLGCQNYTLACNADFVFRDEYGTSHSFYVSRDCTSTGSDPDQFTHTLPVKDSDDGSAMRLDASNPNDIIVRTKDGTAYHFPPVHVGGGYNYDFLTIVDPNGNTITKSGNVITDSVGRSITVGNLGVTWTDSNGASQSVTVALGGTAGPPVATDATNCQFNNPIQSNYQTQYLFGGDLNNVGNFATGMTLTFSGGATTTFQFDQLGEITKITYPSGGYTRYDYHTQFPQFHLAYLTCYADYRTVSAKHVCSSASGSCSPSLEATTTYTPVTMGGDGAITGIDVVDPLSNRTRYGFGALNLSGGTKNPRETDRWIYQGNSTLVKTIHTDYTSVSPSSSCNSNSTCPDYSLPYQVITTLNDVTPNLVSKVVTTFDTINQDLQPCCLSQGLSPVIIDNPTEVDEYDFDGTLRRKTTSTWKKGGIYDVTTLHILNRPLTTTVTDQSTGHVSTTTYVYDTVGNVSSVTVGGTNATSMKTSYLRNSYGDITVLTDPKLNQTTYGYSGPWYDTSCAQSADSAGKPSSITNALSQPTALKYYSCTGLLATVTDPNGQMTKYGYDALGRMTSTNYPDNQTGTPSLTKTYVDTAPQSVTTNVAIASGVTKTSQSLLDGLGRAYQSLLTSDPDGIDYTDTSFDPLERVATVSNPHRATANLTDGVTSYVYDGLGRVCVVVRPDGTAVSGSTCPSAAPVGDVFTVYVGNCTTVTDEAGKTRKSCTDGLGRLTGVWEDTSNLNYKTTYTYDGFNNLTSAVQTGNSRLRSYTYDGMSRLTTAVNPESGTVNYSYASPGGAFCAAIPDAPCSTTSPSPNQPSNGTATVATTYSYDALNRLVKKSYSDTYTANPPTPSASYAYDGGLLTGCGTAPPTLADSYPVGRRTSMCDGSGAASWKHDSVGRVVQERRTIGAVIGDYENDTFNLDGSVASLISLGYGVHYTYGGAARPLAVAHDNTIGGPVRTFVSSATYAPPGELTGMMLGASTGFNGIVVANAYNKRLQPILLSAASPSGTVFSECFDFHLGAAVSQPAPCSFSASTAGDNGNVYQVVNNRDNTRTQNFNYDSLNHIQQAYSSGTQWGETFAPTATGPGVAPTTSGIDAWGNLTNRSGVIGKTNTEPLSVSVGTNNQLGGLGYDAAGNVIINGSASYAYDAENRLIWTSGYRYIYDGNGERVEKCVAANPTTACPTSGANGSLYWKGGGSAALSETDLAGNVTNTYIFFNGERIARNDSAGATHYYFSDHLGSHGVVENATATVCEQDIDYYPYGGLEHDYCPNVIQNYRFTGKERDAESGLDNFGARYNASTMGRFMSADPLGGSLANPQSLNKYTYVLNNPLRYTDPTGLYACADDKNGSHCASKQDQAFEKTLAGLRGKDGDVGRAAGAYGAVNEDNGVTVGFKDLSTKGENGTTTSTIGTDANGNLRANSDVTINSKISGDDYAAAVGHEGSHAADAQDVVKSGITGGLLEGQPIHAGMNITPYQSEQRAYGVTNAILNMQNQSRKFDCGANACTLGRDSGMPGLLPGVIDQIVAHNPVYNQGGQPMSSTNQGPSVVNGVTPNTTVPH